MTTTKEGVKARAEERFRKAEVRATEGANAKAEHDKRAEAVDLNTARLRALRLAKEQAEPAPPAGKLKSRQPKPPAT